MALREGELDDYPGPLRAFDSSTPVVRAQYSRNSVCSIRLTNRVVKTRGGHVYCKQSVHYIVHLTGIDSHTAGHLSAMAVCTAKLKMRNSRFTGSALRSLHIQKMSVYLIKTELFTAMQNRTDGRAIVAFRAAREVALHRRPSGFPRYPV